MKKVLLGLLLWSVSVITSSQIVVQGDITTNTTWNNDNIYILDGWVFVKAGVVLTIEPGTIIKGDFATKGALIIERDAKIIADGTATQPIVFTSQKPAGQRSYGDWGGLIICGRASINVPANAGNGTEQGEAIIEGGVGSIYGGGLTPNNADSSGVIRYVRIEFGGIPFQPNSEINGLTMGGVGNKTVIENVQVSYSGDDAFEWFGGTVNAKNLVSYRNWDDDFDTDFGFRGNIQFGVVIRDPNIADQSGSNGFESDNDGQGTGNTPITQAVFSNITIIGPYNFGSTINTNYKRALHLRRNTRTSVFNSVFTGYPTGLLIDGAATHTNAMNNDLRFKNSVLAQMADTLATTTNPDPNNITGAFNITTWFNGAGQNNMLYNETSELMFNSVSLDSPDLTLNSNSPLTSGADFSDPMIDNNNFTEVNYRGAMNNEDWTACWAEWDPQNEPYTGAIDNSITASISADGDIEFCEGSSVTLMATSSDPNATFLWSNGASTEDITTSAGGTFFVTAESSNHCVAQSNTIEVTVIPTPEVSISADGSTSFCTGGSVTLTSSQANGNEWSNDAVTASIIVTESGNYSVTYTDDNGCSSTSNIISVSVSDSPVPTISTSGGTTICEGEVLTLTSSAGDSYVWSINGNIIPNADEQVYEATEEGLYTVTVTNEDPCDGVGTSNEVVVFVDPAPVADAQTNPDITTLTVQFINESTGATSYLWDFGDDNTSTEANPLHTYTDGGAYTVTLTAYNGSCEDTFTFTLLNVTVEETLSRSVNVFPNPASSTLNVEIGKALNGIYTIAVYNVIGNLVIQNQESVNSNTHTFQLDVSSLQNGVYYLHMQNMNQQGSVIPLMIRH